MTIARRAACLTLFEAVRASRAEVARRQYGLPISTAIRTIDNRLDLPHFRIVSRSRPRSSTLSPIAHRPEDDPEVPLDVSDLARRFGPLTGSPDAVRPLLGPGLQERLNDIWKPYLEVEGLGDRLAATRRSWIEPNEVRAFLDQAAWILDELRRASPR
jgi:hypothetical protein